jgi:hypothetical protein
MDRSRSLSIIFTVEQNPNPTMATQDPDLVAALDELEAAIPELIAAYPVAGDFWDAFASRANPAADKARGSSAAAYAQGRLVEMLRAADMMPDQCQD